MLISGLRACSPAMVLNREHQRLIHIQRRLQAGIRTAIRGKNQNLKEQVHALNTVNPLATLARGYSLTTDNNGELVRSYSQLEAGDTISTRLSQGSITSRVTDRKAD